MKFTCEITENSQLCFVFSEFPLPEDSGKFESLIKTPAK